ncbi:four helix bundle protein [Flavobacterium sp.]|uniref:four helix bundle protein n=1 Tax=Flavobacterium sp. TaxID=239 RepID=UPI004047A13B
MADFSEYGFEKFKVYQFIRLLRVDLKKLTLSFPSHEKYELCSQIARAASSIASNIAEGSGRSSKKDQAHFTNMAYSSSLQLISHINYALDMDYMLEKEYLKIRFKLGEINRLLIKLYKSQVNRKDGLGENI